MKKLFTCILLLFAITNPVVSQHTDSANEFPAIGSGAAYRTLMIPHAIAFDEHPYNHNMHITSDGDYYFTINGGNSSNGQINKFDPNGNLIQTYPILIDGRGLSFNAADGFLYASLYMGDIVRITDLSAGTYVTVFTGIMQNQQGSFAISADGTKFYNFSQGTLNIHDFATGAVINTISNLQFGAGNYGGEGAVAVDTSRIFTWNSFLKTVYIYDTTGNLLQTMVLDSGDNGHSLAIANGYLFVSKDGNYGVGRWYGYNLSGPSGIEQAINQEPLQFFPNPATDVIHLSGDMEKIEIFNITGALVYSENKPGIREINVNEWPRGVYLVSVNSRGIQNYRKLVLN